MEVVMNLQYPFGNWKAGMFDDEDATRAAALDDRVPAPPDKPSVVKSMQLSEDVLAQSTELQQTKDTSFLNAEDVMKALLGAGMAFATGGASLGLAGATGAAAGLESATQRKGQAAAEAQAKAKEFNENFRTIHRGQTNQYIAELQSSGKRQNPMNITYRAGLDALEMASYSGQEGFEAAKSQLMMSGVPLAGITYEGILEQRKAKFNEKNFDRRLEVAQALMDQGQFDQAAEVVGEKYQSWLVAPASNLFSADDPETTNTILEYVVSNAELESTTKSALMDQLQFLKVADPNAFETLVSELPNIRTNKDALVERFDAQYQFLLKELGAEAADEDIKFKLRMLSLISPILSDPAARYTGDPEMVQGMQGMVNPLMNDLMQYFEGNDSEEELPPPPSTTAEEYMMQNIDESMHPYAEEIAGVLDEIVKETQSFQTQLSTEFLMAEIKKRLPNLSDTIDTSMRAWRDYIRLYYNQAKKGNSSGGTAEASTE